MSAPDLMDYATGDSIRPATVAERLESIRAARFDGGAGVIIVDGRRCYVETQADDDVNTAPLDPAEVVQSLALVYREADRLRARSSGDLADTQSYRMGIVRQCASAIGLRAEFDAAVRGEARP